MAELKKPLRLDELKEGDVFMADLPDVEFKGPLYMTGYELNPFARRSDIRFIGITHEGEMVYYINPSKLEFVDGVLMQRQSIHTFGSLGANVERIVQGEINREAIQSLKEFA